MKPSTLVALLSGDLENAIISETPGGIEAQEARGQQLVCKSHLLPKQGDMYSSRSLWDDLKSLGFKIISEHDDLFYEVEFPTGWELAPTEHSMHSNLIDEQGRIRGHMFYKAAFYDRRADMSLRKRYVATLRLESGYGDNYDDKSPERGYVFDTGVGSSFDEYTIIYRTEEYICRPDGKVDDATYWKYAAVRNNISKMADNWLNEHYPDHANPLTYW